MSGRFLRRDTGTLDGSSSVVSSEGSLVFAFVLPFPWGRIGAAEID